MRAKPDDIEGFQTAAQRATPHAPDATYAWKLAETSVQVIQGLDSELQQALKDVPEVVRDLLGGDMHTFADHLHECLICGNDAPNSLVGGIQYFIDLPYDRAVEASLDHVGGDMHTFADHLHKHQMQAEKVNIDTSKILHILEDACGNFSAEMNSLPQVDPPAHPSNGGM